MNNIGGGIQKLSKSRFNVIPSIHLLLLFILSKAETCQNP